LPGQSQGFYVAHVVQVRGETFAQNGHMKNRNNTTIPSKSQLSNGYRIFLEKILFEASEIFLVNTLPARQSDNPSSISGSDFIDPITVIQDLAEPVDEVYDILSSPDIIGWFDMIIIEQADNAFFIDGKASAILKGSFIQHQITKTGPIVCLGFID
jgi:hypothetical protein